MKFRVYVSLKNGVLDPQGVTIQRSLQNLGFDTVTGARVGKFIELEVGGKDKAAAEAEIKKMCDKLLANTVIEDYQIASL